MDYVAEALHGVRAEDGSVSHRHPWDVTIVQVGAGGTGGYAAEAIARVLCAHRDRLRQPGRDWRARLYLVDHDRVEGRNLARQAFGPRDVGRPKVEALRDRLAARFGGAGLLLGVSTDPYDPAVYERVFAEGSALALIVGCVDNAAARRAIARTLERTVRRVWWLDAGNARDLGQVLLGNVAGRAGLLGAIDAATGRAHALPAPSLQQPELLRALPGEGPGGGGRDCAAAVAGGDQSPTINGLLAGWLADYVHRLLGGECRTLRTSIDATLGQVRSAAINPAALARDHGHTLAEVVGPAWGPTSTRPHP